MEKWEDIAGMSGKYRISSLGRVYSVPRIVKKRNGATQTIPGRMLSISEKRIKDNLYHVVALQDRGRAIYEYVHRLVAEAFIENPKQLREVNHKNLIKTDNRVSNLEWASSRKNKLHAVAKGVQFNPNPKKGEQVKAAKLDETKVLKIRRFHAKGWTQEKLAKRFKVTPTNIGYIVRRKSWKHI